MMVNKYKRKGSDWERDAVKLLNERFGDVWQRIPTSGAIGTTMAIPVLKGDLKGKYDFFSRAFVGEAKVGYGGKHMTIQKDWFDKIQEEAEETYSLPLVVLKFERCTTGVRHVVAMSFDTWNTILEEMQYLNNSLLEAHGKIAELQRYISEQADGDGTRP